MRFPRPVSIIGGGVLLLFALICVESIYRDRIFVESLKADFLIQTNAGHYASLIDEVDHEYEDYFVFAALSENCGKYSDCFHWEDYPNVRSVVTNSSELGGAAGYRMFRSCISFDCRPVGRDAVLASPLTQSELSYAMGATETEQTCWETAVNESAASLPIRYRVEYCIIETRLHGRLVSFIASARVAHLYTMAFVPSIWFSEELTISVNYARSEVQSWGFDVGAKTLTVR